DLSEDRVAARTDIGHIQSIRDAAVRTKRDFSARLADLVWANTRRHDDLTTAPSATIFWLEILASRSSSVWHSAVGRSRMRRTGSARWSRPRNVRRRPSPNMASPQLWW